MTTPETEPSSVHSRRARRSAAPGIPSAALADASSALRTQWQLLRGWVGEVVDDEQRDLPTVLDGWDVADLVAHLGRAMSALAVCEPAPAGTVPLSLAEYLGTYATRAQDITEVTRALAREIAAAPLARVDELAAEAFAQLDAFGPVDLVVQARRGPVLLSDMVTSRLIELVVHADDLQRSLARSAGTATGPGFDGTGSGSGPIDRDALDLVARTLLRIVVARGGWSLDVVEPLTWVRLAAGRLPYDVDTLSGALSPRYTSDAVPDLGRMLPLL